LRFKNIRSRLIKYFSVSGIVYFFIIFGMYLLVDILNFDKIFSYIIVYFFAYISEYFMTLFFVFKGSHSISKVIKFIVHSFFFMVFGTFFFKIILQLNINYIYATLTVAFVLVPFRFFSNKYFVYK
jgi:hypothetical protein